MLEVFTVGGGEYLVNTFNAIATWTGSGGFKSLIRVVMVMGLIYALLAVALDFDWRVWFRWFIQSTLVYSVLMVPTVTVKVTDRIDPGLAPATVANVPIGLGVMASFTSQVSDYLTTMAETVFVMPGALQYTDGGFAYGARMWDKLRGFEIRDPVFKANLDTYLKQCSYYDILLGQKSLKILSESADLWAELGVNAANNRGMKYLTDTGGGTVDIEGKTCAQAWILIDQAWDTQINTYALPFARSMYPNLTAAAANSKLSNDVPVIAQLLTGAAPSRNQFLKQKSVIDAFETSQLDFGNYDADAFALQRADTQTRNSMTTAAEQGMIWIPILNVVLTVVFYALFPIVFPLFLFPKTGPSTLKGYFAGFFYLAAWGPIYALIHMFVMDRLASQTNAASPGGPSLGTWAGIDAVNQDIATMAGFLMMSVPVLALMVMRGTMSVASSVGQMMTPVSSGSDAASVERTTGNYTYGDVSHSNYSGNNHQQSQWQMAPSIATGPGRSMFVNDDGVSATNYGSGRPVFNSSGGMDVLPFKPMWNQGYTSNLRTQGQAYLNEAERLENATADTWRTSTGRFGSSTQGESSASGSRWTKGSSSDTVATTGGNVTVQGGSTNTRSVDAGVTAGVTNGNRTADTWNGGLGGAMSWGDERGGGGGENGDGGQERGALDFRLDGSLGKQWTDQDYTDASVTAQRRAGTNDSLTSGVTVSGTSGTSSSDRTYRSNELYGDTSRTSANTTGTDWRLAEDLERRRTAAQYRELGTRMVAEADYAESSGFNMSQDMSNLIGDRYRDLQLRDPERMLPDLSNPNLDLNQMRRRDDGIREVMGDLMGDIQRRDLSDLGDVGRIGASQPPSSIGGQPVGIGPLAPPRGALEASGGLSEAPDGSGGGYALVPVGRGDRSPLPVAGSIRSGLGGRVNPVTGEPGEHKGIDIAAAAGTPIVLQAGGVVERVEFQAGGAGNYVVINHGNGVLTKYFHMESRSELVPGREVEAGTVVGQVGSTGRSTGPHLHYEVWKEGSPVDPRRFAFKRTDSH